MTTLGWAFLVVSWTLLTAFTVWCFKLVLSPTADAHEADLPPSGRM